MDESVVWVLESDEEWAERVAGVLRAAGFVVRVHTAPPDRPLWAERDLLVVSADLLPVPDPPRTTVALAGTEDGDTLLAACREGIRWCLPKVPGWLAYLPAALQASQEEAEQRAESAIYARVLRQMQEGVIIEDTEGRLVFVSPRAAQLLGAPPEALLGQHSIQFIDPRDRPQVLRETAKRPEGIASQYEARIQRQDGSIVPVWIAGTPLFEAGRFAGVLSLFRDLSRERLLQERAQALQRVAVAVSEQWSLTEIFRLARDALRAVIAGAQDVMFTILDVDDNSLRPVNLGEHSPLVTLLEELLRKQAAEITFPLASLPSQWREAIAKGRPVISSDVEGIGRALFGAEVTAQALRRIDIAGVAALPLRAGGLVRGVAALVLDRPHIQQEDLDLSMAVIGLVAAAIESRTVIEQARYRADVVERLFEVAQATALSTEPAELATIAARHFIEAFSVEEATISLWDREGDALRVVVDIYREPGQDAFEFWRGQSVYPLAEYPATRRVMETGRPLTILISDPQADPHERAYMRREGVKTLIILPLVYKGQPIGVVELEDSFSERQLTAEQMSLAMIMAAQVAAAIENARLHEDLRRRLDELTALNEIGRAVAAVLDLKELVEVVHWEISRFLPAAHFYVALWDRESDRISVPVIVEGEDRLYDQEVGWGGIVGWVLRQGKPLLVDDVQEPNALPEEIQPATVGEPDIRSLVAIPLAVGGEVIGVLSVQSTRPCAYSSQDVDFLTAVGRQVAIAFHNARLYAEARRRAEELAALNVVASRLGQTLELEEVLEAAIEEVVRVLGVEGSAVSLVDERAGELTIRAQRGLHRSYVGVSVPLGKGLSGEVVRTGRVLVTGDVRSDPRLAVPAFAQEGIQAMALVPMWAHGKVVGVLSAMSHHPRRFSEREIDLLQAIASQVGMAVENARLYEAERAQRRTAETLRSVGAVLTSTLEVGQVLQWLLGYLGELVPCDRATVMLLEEGEVGQAPCLRVAAVRGYEELPDGRAAIGHTVRLDADQLLAGVVEGGVPVLIRDTADDPRWRYESPVWVTRSWIGVPLSVRGTTIGMLSLARENDPPFDGEDLALAADIASHAAIAIENARLYRDVQEHAARLETAYTQLKEADRLKDEIIQNVSHELRTPLTFIKGYVELLRAQELGSLSPSQMEALEIIARRTDHLTRLVNDFVTLQVVSPATLDLRAVDLGQLVHNVVEDSRSAAARAGIEVREEIAESLAPILADAGRIAQVLDNLISNAIKFSPDGGTITVRVQEEGERVRVEVTDTGIGIPEAEQTQIFERFYQVDGTVRRRFGGAGLGLSIVKQIVEAHGGEVGVVSTVGKGSTFFFTLPKAAGGGA